MSKKVSSLTSFRMKSRIVNLFQGVLYFGDDDNTYDLRLFDEIRDTGNVSVFPVGLVGEYAVSAPVVRDVSFLGEYVFVKSHSKTFPF